MTGGVLRFPTAAVLYQRNKPQPPSTTYNMLDLVGCNVMYCCGEALLLYKVSGNRLPKGGDISLKPTKGISYNLQLQPI